MTEGDKCIYVYTSTLLESKDYDLDVIESSMPVDRPRLTRASNGNMAEIWTCAVFNRYF